MYIASTLSVDIKIKRMREEALIVGTLTLGSVCNKWKASKTLLLPCESSSLGTRQSSICRSHFNSDPLEDIPCVKLFK